jgi:hypothetical protein
MGLLVICRAVASKSSRAYVTGYLAAAVIAVIASLDTDNSQLHTSIVLAVLVALSVLLALKVERRREVLVFTPWLAQLLLISIYRPAEYDMTGNTVALALCGVLAAAAYFAASRSQQFLGEAALKVRGSSLATAYLALWFGAFTFHEASDYVFPVLLASAGAMTLHYYWYRSQSAREWSCTILVLSLMWLLSVAGVENTQVYSHIGAAALAGYAYWRHVRGEAGMSLNYLRAMFAVATVPLVLQALGGQAGDLYGWLLILQQVGFMILGIAINRRFLTWWGLYVSVAAVLYQLRHLGWAALSVLALFVIGVAVYRLSRDANTKRHDG